MKLSLAESFLLYYISPLYSLTFFKISCILAMKQYTSVERGSM